MKKSVSLFLLYSITLNCVFSCEENPKKPGGQRQVYSKTQTRLFQLIDSYKADYHTADDPKKQEEVMNKYHEKVEHFLIDTLGRYIDSMTVSVDTVIQEGWLVTTKFHTRDIMFQYGLKFQDSMPPKFDSLYKFMINLRPVQEVTVNFMHLGGGGLYKPNGLNGMTVQIFAYPRPLNF